MSRAASARNAAPPAPPTIPAVADPSTHLLHPPPRSYIRCYCSICRKVSGGGGFAINIMGEWDSLQLEGRERLREYRVLLPDEEAPGELSDKHKAALALLRDKRAEGERTVRVWQASRQWEAVRQSE